MDRQEKGVMRTAFIIAINPLLELCQCCCIYGVALPVNLKAARREIVRHWEG